MLPAMCIEAAIGPARRVAIAAGLALAGGCAASYQSARVLPRGHTQVTVAMSRTTANGVAGVGRWAGDVQARAGVANRFDAGLRLARTPSFDDAVSAVVIDGKLAVIPERLSLAVPAGLLWSDADRRAYGVMPTAFLGVDVAPTVEIVLAPKLMLFYGDAGADVELGASLGLRFTDPLRQVWALQPELGLTTGSYGGADAAVITIGVGNSFGG